MIVKVHFRYNGRPPEVYHLILNWTKIYWKNAHFTCIGKIVTSVENQFCENLTSRLGWQLGNYSMPNSANATLHLQSPHW